MSWTAGRIAEAMTGAACLLWVGASAPAAGDGLPAEVVPSVPGGTGAPDLGA